MTNVPVLVTVLVTVLVRLTAILPAMHTSSIAGGGS
jgi:hypothetical protein